MAKHISHASSYKLQESSAHIARRYLFFVFLKLFQILLSFTLNTLPDQLDDHDTAVGFTELFLTKDYS